MTTTGTTRPVAPATAAPAPAAELAALTTQPPASDTPRRLRRYQLVTAIAVLVLGLIAVVQLTQLRTDLSAAPALGTQHLRLGEVSATISAAGNRATADALAGSGTDQSSALVATAAGLLVQAAAAEPSQAATIASINADLVRYGQLLTAGQFDQADQLLSGSIQPALDQLGQALSAQAMPASWWTSPLVALGLGALVLVGVGWISYQVAQRSHRVLNAGLLAAVVTVVAIAGLAAGGTPVSGGAGQSSRSVVQASTQLTTAQLQAEAASRTLLDSARQKRWDKAAQDAFAKADQQAADGFTRDVADRYDKLQAAHKQVVAALAAGNWAKASTLLAKDGTAVAGAETDLAKDIADQRAALRASATSDSATDSVLFLFEVGAAVLALAGAFLTVRGLQTRIEEYR